MIGAVSVGVSHGISFICVYISLKWRPEVGVLAAKRSVFGIVEETGRQLHNSSDLGNTAKRYVFALGFKILYRKFTQK